MIMTDTILLVIRSFLIALVAYLLILSLIGAGLHAVAKVKYENRYTANYNYYNEQLQKLKSEHGVTTVLPQLQTYWMGKLDREGGTSIGNTLCFINTGVVIKIALADRFIAYGKRKDVMNTLKHELAHAIDCNLRGGSDHGEHWQKIAKSLGVNPSPVTILDDLSRHQ